MKHHRDKIININTYVMFLYIMESSAIENKKQRNRKYYANNREREINRAHKYYIENQETIKQKHSQSIKCTCGGVYTYANKKRHLKSPLHNDIMRMNELD